jgi:hypothetical protein
MHSDWFNGTEILQGRWQHGEKVGYCYPSGLEKTLCKWDIYVLLVKKGLSTLSSTNMLYEAITFYNINRRKTLCVLFNAFMYLFIVEGQKVV